ncbi:asparaginase [Pseudonocardia kujensis]|uniref:asparaginase n=1 Tax=Pseudonocardia kujensis TaxID=1128675 RepID=UPI001E2F3C26|nr:asparaginase [Pseudonocardia kujensis]MCE0764628.1 asparaginase [Pseudonocardia kujensis]
MGEASSVATGAGTLATVVRSGVVESVHLGHLATIGGPQVGRPGATFFPRSALKPVQAAAMLRAGLDLDGELLALAAASHAGLPRHREGAARILAAAGLDTGALRNTPDLPLDPDAAAAWRAAGSVPEPVAQNCSGKHAAMLATCVAAGWDTAGYLDPAHALQQAIRRHVEALTGDEVRHVAVDGCGAPLFSCTVAGLARAFSVIATADPGSPEGRVAAAVRAHPEWLGGPARPVTRILRAVPGLVAKDGAEGVFAAALPDGRALALTVLDGAARPVPAVVAATLRALGVRSPELDATGHVPVLGHGAEVGAVEPAVPGAPVGSSPADTGAA